MIHDKSTMTPKQIIKFRKDLELTQEQLAGTVGTEQHTVSQWERDKNRPRGAT
jgi:DNA-binding transcriptional regulator YiaG